MGNCRVCGGSLENNIYKGQHGICKVCDNARRSEYLKSHPLNAEKNRQAFRTFYTNHKAQVQERNRKWKENNPEQNKLNRQHENRLRKYRDRNAVGSFTRKECETKLRECNYKCIYCGQSLSIENITIDHLIPLSKGGTNYIDNLVPSCLECNCKKYNKILYRY